jgi:ATP-binding cassette subfamily G (WHITE) protein 2 (SNQ2)
MQRTEWMLEVIGAGASASSKRDWHQTWVDSDEKSKYMDDLDRIVEDRRKVAGGADHQRDAADEKATYAASFSVQLRTLLMRQWKSYYRDVPYLMGKLCVLRAQTFRVDF